jgi:adapter protein MecA 1/2
MKFERIDDNRITIILSNDDLEAHNIDIRNFKSNSVAYQQLFWDMMEHAQEELGFDVTDSQLLVETSPDSNGNFIITITKSRNSKNPFEEIDKLIAGRIGTMIENATNTAIGYDFSSNEGDSNDVLPYELIKFRNIDNLIDLAKLNESFSTLTSVLYKHNKDYFLLIKRNKRNSKLISKFLNYVTEFNGDIIEPFIILPILEERGTTVIKAKAIKTLATKF